MSLWLRMNMESRKSPKLSRANQEGQRSPRLPTKKPPVRSPSLTRREFSMDGITEVWVSYFMTLYLLCQRLCSLCKLIVSQLKLCLFSVSLSFASKHNYLAQVTSNIWGTKFKIVGLASFLPANLGAGKDRQSDTRANSKTFWWTEQQRRLFSTFQSSTRRVCSTCSRDRWQSIFQKCGRFLMTSWACQCSTPTFSVRMRTTFQVWTRRNWISMFWTQSIIC